MLMGIAGCSKTLDPSLYPTPESLYDAAVAMYERGDCKMAQQGFQRLIFELPPRDTRHANVRFFLAECQLKQHLELEAAQQFRRVSDDFPRHELAPQALLRAGDAYGELWDNPELDPTYGETALATYTELLGRYPNSQAADSGRARIQSLNEMFAGKGYKNGVFYLRLRAFDSAIIYFKDVVARYPRTEAAGKSVVKLIEAYARIGYVEEKTEMCLYRQQYYPDADGADKWCAPDS
jgi:outer membrane protein assembly factor BamD